MLLLCATTTTTWQRQKCLYHCTPRTRHKNIPHTDTHHLSKKKVSLTLKLPRTHHCLILLLSPLTQPLKKDGVLRHPNCQEPPPPFLFSSLSLLSPPFILLPRPSFTYVLLLSLSFLFLPRLFPPGMKGRNKEVQEYNREVGQEGKDTIFVISISRTAFLLR